VHRNAKTTFHKDPLPRGKPPLGLPLSPLNPDKTLLLQGRVRVEVKAREDVAVKVEAGAMELPNEGTPSPQPLHVGSRLQTFVVGWDNLTEDSYILRLFREGYRIQFTSLPPLSMTPREVVPPRDTSRRLAILQQVQQLESKRQSFE
jgi:hypothetical protein